MPMAFLLIVAHEVRIHLGGNYKQLLCTTSTTMLSLFGPEKASVLCEPNIHRITCAAQ